MRSKPLLKPVVEALERQEAINRMLLSHINFLRNELGYPPVSESELANLVDGGPSAPVAAANPVAPIANPVSTVSEKSAVTPTAAPVEKPANAGKRRYAETLMSTSEGLGMCCDDFDLLDDGAEYAFVCDGNTGEFYPNPDFAAELLKMGRRAEWMKLAKTDPEAIPELPKGMKYVMTIEQPGKTVMSEGCWVITTPAEIKISLADNAAN